MIIPRILFVVPLPPPVHGSAVVSQQIRDSKVINEAFHCDWVNISLSRTIGEIGKNNLFKFFRFVGAFCRSIGKLLTHRYDLCYLAITCHGIGFLKDAPFVLLCKLFGRRIVIHQHNKGMAKDVERWPYRWLLPLCYSNTKVILLSQHLYPDIEQVVQKENIIICPNGIVVNDKLKTAKREMDNRIPRLLFLGNLSESKGVFVLMDALKNLADKGFSFTCDYVGGETKEIDARRFATEIDKRGLRDLVTYKGRRFGEDKEELFLKADVFVFPTYEDCFPLVLLEAMSHQLPIITTGEGGIPDEVLDGVNGLICKRNDPKSLADCIERLLTDVDLRLKMGEEGFKRFKALFTSEHFENNLKEILSKIVSTKFK